MDLETQRVDQWLWVARFFKTRALAQAAIAAGHVRYKGERVKASRLLRVGDVLQLQLHALPYELRIEGFAKRRGSATEAQQLYSESPESQAARAQRQAELKAMFSEKTSGRPSKRDRRALDQFLRQGLDF